ncbi:MAG: ABC transporter permease [Candidatus Binatia bacterium]
MSKREVIARYRGSMLGILWSVLLPLCTLAIYTFVFGVVMKVRWGAEPHGEGEAALIFFAGLIVHGLFAECVNRAPGVILANVNYVKKVIFPLEILPWVNMGTTLFHSTMSCGVLLLFAVALHGNIPWTAVTLPLILFPLVLVTMGISWVLASLGVFLRDIGQTIGLVNMALLFLSPILYPISNVPESLQPFLFLSPLTFIVEQTRGALLWGQVPEWRGLVIYCGCGVLVAWGGLLWFQRTRRGFADVL